MPSRRASQCHSRPAWMLCKSQQWLPGAPMGMADIAEVLWRDHLKHNPKIHRIDRDRFVLSNGHGSMLLYSLLHLTGYDVNLDDLKTSVNCTVAPQVTLSTVIPLVSKPPLAHSVKV